MPEISIWKYSVLAENIMFRLWMPAGAKILCVQVQRGDAQIWAMVDPKQEKEARHFRIVVTGLLYKIEDLNRFKYIGTFQLGEFVGHLFEDGGN